MDVQLKSLLLGRKSLKLQNRVAEIVRHVEFNADQAAADLFKEEQQLVEGCCRLIKNAITRWSRVRNGID